MTTVAYSVELTIPDNEAYTTLVTLVRLGIRCRKLERSDVWVFEIEDAALDGLEPTIRSIETIFNPNKHVLRALSEPRPRAGEVWVGERDESEAPGAALREVQFAGRVLAGVRRFRRYKGWRLWESEAEAASTAVVANAAETLLCNPAFQVIIQ
jgi:hypothetical protein